MIRSLITGGSGFIGSHVVDKLADAGYRPRIYDLQPSPHHEPGSVDTVVGDLFDHEALAAAMEPRPAAPRPQPVAAHPQGDTSRRPSRGRAAQSSWRAASRARPRRGSRA